MHSYFKDQKNTTTPQAAAAAPARTPADAERAARIEELRRQVAAGTYQTDPVELAKRMIDHDLAD